MGGTPAGSAVRTCALADPCAEPWKKVQTEVDKINGMSDIRERNKAISASYARLYKAAPELKWAGAAAFASKQVGCGMDTAKTYLDDYPGGIEGAIRDRAYSDSSIDPVSLTMYDARQTLGAGNLAVYNELYPALRFYQQNKSTMSEDQILSCLEDRDPPSHADIIRGMRQTMNGNGKAGALTMLHHEQYDTLQKVAYDSSWLFRRSLDVSRFFGYPPVTFVVDSGCTTTDSSKIVDFKNYKGALYDPVKRWPFAQDCAGKFIELSSSPATHGAVDNALDNIIRAGGAP